MRVEVRYFATLREQRGRDTEQVEVHEGCTARALYHRLFPTIDGQRVPVLYAVNQEYVQAEHALTEGDEVVFVPPLGGG